MADAPWRCSECGTINEPVANSCRTCGRWPSLFDLQESVLEEPTARRPVDQAELDVGTFEPEPYRPETFEAQPFEVGEVPAGEEAPESPADRRRRVVTSLVVPLAFVLYIVISIVFGDRGGG